MIKELNKNNICINVSKFNLLVFKLVKDNLYLKTIDAVNGYKTSDIEKIDISNKWENKEYLQMKNNPEDILIVPTICNWSWGMMYDYGYSLFKGKYYRLTTLYNTSYDRYIGLFVDKDNKLYYTDEGRGGVNHYRIRRNKWYIYHKEIKASINV